MPLHLMVKWEVVSPNSRYRGQWESNISNIILYSRVLVFDLKHIKCGGGLGGGGGVIFFLHFILFPTSLEKIILGINNKIYFCLEKQ